MTKWIIDTLSHIYEIIVVFANTGQELEETLIFVDKCDKKFGFNLVWVEAVFHKGVRINGGRRKGKGTTHRIVSFETACRDGSLFKAMVNEYGIPNVAYPHCTRELKTAPLHDFIRNGIGWRKGDYLTAIGIRADEPKRNQPKEGIIYPFTTMNEQTEDTVDEWWKKQGFKLGLMKHEGNCSWCWKKSLSKHMLLLRDRPEIYDVPSVMECDDGLKGYHTNKKKRVFFRENRSVFDLIQLYHKGKKSKEKQIEIILDDIESECGESCEAF